MKHHKTFKDGEDQQTVTAAVTSLDQLMMMQTYLFWTFSFQQLNILFPLRSSEVTNSLNQFSRQGRLLSHFLFILSIYRWVVLLCLLSVMMQVVRCCLQYVLKVFRPSQMLNCLTFSDSAASVLETELVWRKLTFCFSSVENILTFSFVFVRRRRSDCDIINHNTEHVLDEA